MKTTKTILIFLLTFACMQILAVERYVDASSATPVSPYTSWSTAATTIQDAVDVSSAGDEIIVTNGIYNTGGKPATGFSLTNRVCVEIDVTIKSVNGPESTVIVGAGPLSSNAVRGVWLSYGTLSGFTVSNGYTIGNGPLTYQGKEIDGGGIYALSWGIVTNCIITHNVAYYQGGGTAYGNIYDSEIRENNIAYTYGGGGGTAYGNLYRCNIISNTGVYGGGSFDSALYNCLVTRNVGFSGAGAHSPSTTSSHIIKNCTIVDNVGSHPTWTTLAGGVYRYNVYNSIIYNNTADSSNNYSGTICKYDCTYPMPNGEGNVTNNPEIADSAAGDYRIKPISPCINAGTNALAAITPDYGGNPRIIGGTVDMGAYEYLLAEIFITNRNFSVAEATTSATIGGTNDSYCVGDLWWSNVTAGTIGNVTRLSDSNSWTAIIDNLVLSDNFVRVYCEDYLGGLNYDEIDIARGTEPIGYPLVVITSASFIVEYTVENIEIAGTNNEYVTGGMAISNSANLFTADFIASESWTAPQVPLEVGTNMIQVSGTNEYGNSSSDSIEIIRNRAPIYTNYVSLIGNHISPFESWADAATNIQDAVDAVAVSGIVTVSNGIYNIGERITPGHNLSNRVLISKDITLESLNGAEVTFIEGAEGVGGGTGAGAIRGVYISAGILRGFTIRESYSLITGSDYYDEGGGGVCCFADALVEDCVMTNNHVNKRGGGVLCYNGGKVNRCIMVGNSSGGGGGGAYCYYGGEVMNSLMIENNVANNGGGIFCFNGGAVVNCTIANNYAGSNGGGIRTADAAVTNTIIYYNRAAVDDNWSDAASVNYGYCCAPTAPSGVGNITVLPEFVNTNGGNYRIVVSSQCKDAGTNQPWMLLPDATDLDGNPRIRGNIVDIGAYETIPEPYYLLFIIYQLLFIVYLRNHGD